jgi:hypothetical protein
MQASSAELVYGEPLRIPGELLTPTAHPVEPANLITQLSQNMARLRPVPVASHASPATFVHQDLQNLHSCLSPSGHYPPSSGHQSLLGPLAEGQNAAALTAHKSVSVSADRVKPAYSFIESVYGNPLSTLFLGNINMGTWPSRLGGSQELGQ